LSPTAWPAVLLDTCAAIWLADAGKLEPAALAAILAAGHAEGILISPISAWEIGMLSRPTASRPAALQFLPDPATWFARLMAGPGIRPAPFTPAIAIAASQLPGAPHRDPADRLLIATARHLGVPLVTRDAAIGAYAAAGFVTSIAC
jgi:PIN domain nuclease of toxin-antitoxin system